MQTISSIKANLETLLTGQLAQWTYTAINEAQQQVIVTESAIKAQRPPDGAKIISAGVQCIIEDNAGLSVMPYMGGSASQGRYTHRIHLELWMPEDLESPQINVAPTVFALAGIDNSPVHRIMTAPAFLQCGVPMNPVNSPRTEVRKATSIIYLNSYCINE